MTVLEGDDVVGGISRTAQYKGYRFDIGGHRFFTKIEPVERLWHEILGNEFISVPRLSRIYYEGKYFDYPLKAGNALKGMGLWRASADHAELPEGPFVAESGGRESRAVGDQPIWASGCTRHSSRHTRKRFGAFRARRFVRNGRRSGSRIFRWAKPFSRRHR